MSRLSGKDIFGLLGGETLPAASGVWKTRAGSLAWKHHLVLKALQQADTQGTESYLVCFFFFWPQRPIRWSTVNAKTYTMSKSGDHAEMIYSCYTRFRRISLEGRGAHARSGLLLCLPAARVQVCDEWRTARDLCLCSVSLRTSQVVKVTHTFINASGKSESKKVRPHAGSEEEEDRTGLQIWDAPRADTLVFLTLCHMLKLCQGHVQNTGCWDSMSSILVSALQGRRRQIFGEVQPIHLNMRTSPWDGTLAAIHFLAKLV